MTNMMKVRITSEGPEAWRLIIQDVETGKPLPVMYEHPITLRVDDSGCLVADLTILVESIDLEVPAVLSEEPISPADAESLRHGGGMLVPKASAQALAPREALQIGQATASGAAKAARGVADLTDEALAETVDDFAARTVALALDGPS